MGETAKTVQPKQDYLVLARKYRPQDFGTLVGQDALVQTLSNAIKADKLHHAYVLTGIRGTGKTSTARILAMALNCENGPAIEWPAEDAAAAAIAAGKHVDVLEFDAASHRGIDDIRDLFEGVAYAPVQGRYKVYIIDEVHMLTTQAFNALLKTLEEPPANVKFIFATTEVHKIPVTVLSRCQRFDLKRVPAATLQSHYENILNQEGLTAEPAALQLIARAADGSVRDGLSLLDQAIALAGEDTITHDVVAGMLGLGDRTRLYDLLDALFGGEAQQVLDLMAEFYAKGQDGLLIVQDLLHMVHTLTRLKLIPGLAGTGELTELEQTRALPLAEKMALENLSRAYQMLLTAAQEAKVADRPFEAVEMALLRVVHLAPIPALQTLLQQGAGATAATPKQEGTGLKKPAEPEPAPAPVRPVLPTDWAGVVAAVQATKPGFAAILGQQVRCLEVAETRLTLTVQPGLHGAQDIVRDLKSVLQEHTSQPWAIALEEAGENAPATLAETEAAEQAANIAAAKEDPTVQAVLESFPGAEVVDVVKH